MALVTFRLEKEDDNSIIYWYFPEGKEANGHGVIVYDKNDEEIAITEVAPNDLERDISPEELNELAEAINQMVRERGGTDFVEMTTETVHSVFYGDHAIREILKNLRNGVIPQKGSQIWY